MVLTKPELIASLQNEVRILLHLATKIDRAKLDYRPTPKQRSTVELLRYLSMMGPALVQAAKAGAFDGTAWAAAEQAAIHFSVLDVLAGSLPGGFDVVACSLFLHHLAEEQAVLLLQAMADATQHLVLVNDLRRSAVGLALTHLAAWTLSGSDVVRVDGPRSVRAAFTVHEAAALARAAGLKGAIVERHWPFRFLLSWERSR
jgi:hypothetical protein